MHRLFDAAPSRHRHRLDGRWDFVVDPDDEGREDYVESFPDDAESIAVPGAWNTEADHHNYEGAAWYRRTFALPESATARLRFEAVANEADVWVDGERVASHYGGYTPFGALLEDLSPGEHEVVVRADNTRDAESVPKPGSDWHPYGGITREVSLEEVPDRFVAALDIAYDLSGTAADVTATVAVRNLGDPTEASLSLDLAGERTEASVDLPAGESTHRLDLSAAVERWEPGADDPALYEVTAALDGDGLAGDERRDRIGFRTIEVDGRDLLVNGDPVEVAGVNRHEDHPEWGHAQPVRLMELDAETILRAGCNAVRTSHYPNHPRWLDYCDELGLLVIEEIPYWQYDSDRFHRGPVLERGKTMLREMIRRDRHHPSIVAWSVHNECANEEAGVREATRELVATVEDLDDSRPTTLATNSPDDDVCLQEVDVACINGYPGWYSDDTWDERLDRVEDRHEGMPLIVSEFGAGAVYGERTRENQKWSEGYQADLLVDAIETFRARESVTGFTIWQYCDTRTDRRKEMGRPKSKNNKGIVDEYRRPKEAYRAVRELLTGERR
jgi:beta-glucuronidase